MTIEAKTHPAIADKLVMIDFDATIVPWGPGLMGDRDPLPGAVDAIQSLKARGFRIGIFTSRLSRKWHESEVGPDSDGMYSVKKIADFSIIQRKFVEDLLIKFDIPFDFITAEKIPAQAYIDDKAIGFRGDWAAVLGDKLLD